MAADSGDTSKMAGGLGDAHPPAEDVKKLVEELKPDIIEKIRALPASDETSSRNRPEADAKVQLVQYKSQVVSGTNYFVSLLVNDVAYHARIYHQPWTNTKEVSDVKAVEKNAEIGYF